MSIVTIIVLVILAYIVQVLLILWCPYYLYRKRSQVRTIKGFTQYTRHEFGDYYLPFAFIPLVGFLGFMVSVMIASFVIVTKWIYITFIKK